MGRACASLTGPSVIFSGAPPREGTRHRVSSSGNARDEKRIPVRHDAVDSKPPHNLRRDVQPLFLVVVVRVDHATDEADVALLRGYRVLPRRRLRGLRDTDDDDAPRSDW
jgi:hypothetical protein